VADDGYREAGSSGGLVSWLLVELLTRGVVDGVVHVKATTSKTPGDPLFQYTVSRSANEIREGAKSRYYPVEMSGAIAEILSRPGRYAVVGVPCFIKGVRLACRESEELRARVAVTVAIVCGHLKTSGFAEFLAWQCGVAPSELRAIDFRSKIKNQSASSYGISIVGERNGLKKVVDRPMSALQGSNWGHGLFKFKACDFCDDVVGETADISVGDAWLPEYESDWRGTNVVVVRSALIKSIISEAIDAGSLAMNHLPIDKVVASQAGGFRHRRDGLAYRLHREDAAKRWRPPKRVLPSVEHLNARQKDIYELRYRISELSHQAFATAKELKDCSIFMKEIGPLLSRYDRHFRMSIGHRVVGKVRKAARFLTGKG
jgi:coenzyme F420-reducing hydrogenase beta subunit